MNLTRVLKYRKVTIIITLALLGYLVVYWLVLSKVDWLSCIETKDGSNENCANIEKRNPLALPMALAAYFSLLAVLPLAILTFFQSLRIKRLKKGKE